MEVVYYNSVYVPQVLGETTEEFIKEFFYKFDIAKVSWVDFTEMRTFNGKPYKSAFIHFEYWFKSEMTERMQNNITVNPKGSRVIYDDPKYWVLLPNRNDDLHQAPMKLIHIDVYVLPYEHYTEQEMWNIIDQAKFGQIDRVEMLEYSETDGKYARIYYKRWYPTVAARAIQKELAENKISHIELPNHNICWAITECE